MGDVTRCFLIFVVVWLQPEEPEMHESWMKQNEDDEVRTRPSLLCVNVYACTCTRARGERERRERERAERDRQRVLSVNCTNAYLIPFVALPIHSV